MYRLSEAAAPSRTFEGPQRYKTSPSRHGSMTLEVPSVDESAKIVVVFELLVSSAQKRVWRSMTGVVEIIADSDLISESEARDLAREPFVCENWHAGGHASVRKDPPQDLHFLKFSRTPTDGHETRTSIRRHSSLLARSALYYCRR